MKMNAVRLGSLIVVAGFGCLPPSQAAAADAALRIPAAPDASESAIYVDGRIGRDSNFGTKESPVRSIARAAELLRSPGAAACIMRLNPGIHVVAKPVALVTDRDLAGQRLVVEASTLPDDPAWTPEAMPIVINSSGFGEIPGEAPSFVVSFLVEASHVTLRGLKFHGYPRANSRYFPVARFDKTRTDLVVEQCLFVADPNAAHIQVGVIAHGDGIKVDHCVFYQARNAVVFWENGANAIKTGNALTHSIIVGAGQSAVWTAWPDRNFAFHHNVVARCKHVWIRNADNSSTYAAEDCIMVDNQHRTGIACTDGVHPEPFDLAEHNVTTTGEIALRLVDDLDHPLPRDYLHPLPGSLGRSLEAGLFRNQPSL